MPHPFDVASKQAQPRLEVIAATESASAFNDEHHRQTEKHAAGFPFLLKYWDATLDERACPKCSGLDGGTRPWGIDFEGGAVPAVHPSCRCREGTLFIPIATITEE